MSGKENKMQQPVRIAMAMAMWAAILWLLTLGHPRLVPLAKAVFIIYVVPSGLVEWLKYRGVVGDNRAGVLKLVGFIGMALVWYFGYR